MHILSLRNVTKQYRNVIAVDDVTFDIPAGSMFGLLGPNGAGKTTLIRIVTAIIAADSGEVLIQGERQNSAHPARIGYLPEERGLYKKMRVGEHLLYLAQLKGLSSREARRRIQAYIERFDIADWWHKEVQELSKGMQQKIQFIAAVVHRPSLIILDEPFSGLDPINTNVIKDEIHRLNRDGASVIFSTHRMEQVEEICEHIALIHKGRNVLLGRVSEIKDSYKEGIFRIQYEGQLPDDLNGSFQVISDTDGDLVIKVEEEMNANDLLRELLGRGFIIRGFQEVKPSLNEIFVKTVNQLDHA